MLGRGPKQVSHWSNTVWKIWSKCKL